MAKRRKKLKPFRSIIDSSVEQVERRVAEVEADLEVGRAALAFLNSAKWDDLFVLHREVAATHRLAHDPRTGNQSAAHCSRNVAADIRDEVEAQRHYCQSVGKWRCFTGHALARRAAQTAQAGQRLMGWDASISLACSDSFLYVLIRR